MSQDHASVARVTIVDRELAVTVPLLHSALLSEVPGVVHAFTTREGGSSQGPFASLNLSTNVGDERAAVEANRAAVLEALGRKSAAWVSLRQVHGADVVQVTRQAGRSIEADGLWTRDRAAVLAILVADCVPALVCDRKGRAVAAVHAGWRGTEQKILARMIKRLADEDILPRDLVCALGPAIGPQSFEIGPEVAMALRAAYPEAEGAIVASESGRFHADLWALNRQCLISAGVPEENIDVLRTCTVETPTLYSHRRDGGATGRQAGVIAFAA